MLGVFVGILVIAGAGGLGPSMVKYLLSQSNSWGNDSTGSSVSNPTAKL